VELAVTPALTLDITHLAAGGDGIGRASDGRVVLCEGALPGERVEATVVLERRDFLRARTVAVLQASPDRRDPACPHVAEGCGGCTWPYVRAGETEASLKAAIVGDALRRIAHLPDAVVGTAPITVSDVAYRTTVRLVVDAHGRAAYRRRHGHDTVASDSCLVAHPLLEELIVKGRFAGAGGVLLRVGVAGGERLVCPDRRGARVTVPPGTVVARVGDRRARIHEEVAGRRWRVSAASFFQSGPAAAEALTRAVADASGGAVGPGARIVDLYAGVGVLGGALAAASGAAQLVAVESSAEAADDAAHNLADLDARVVHAEVVAAAGRLGPSPDLVIADPARTGLGPSAAAAVASLRAPVVVLVSCDPASLARDAALLDGHGYTLDRVEVVDAFPSTFHVETVSRFSATR
jgi:23S rRNA (uracil1939-C5)-methyltransferase